MSNTNFPTSIDAPTNPQATDLVSVVPHHLQHGLENDAIVALETKVGITSSADTTSMDFKLSGIPAADKAASKTGTETLTNKTLTAPVISTITNTGTVTLPTATDTLVGKATTDILTNKTITGTTNNVAAASILNLTTAVSVAGAAAPSTGQVLTATGTTTATWQNTSGKPVTLFVGTTTLSISPNGSQVVVVWAKGTSQATQTVTLSYNAVQKDQVQVTSSGNIPFSMVYTETPSAATHNITIGGSVADGVIMAMLIG